MIFARERDSFDQSLFSIGFTISWVILIVLAFSGIIIRRLVGRGLAPLSRLVTQVRNIDESSLQVRAAHKGWQSSEMAPIEDQINHLLERLESAFEREKRFSSNVAHELHTPLSELKTLAEVGKMVPEDVDEIKVFFTDVGEVSTQMEKIVTTLLELARSDAGWLLMEPEDIDLTAYCDDVWRRAINGQGRGKQLVTTIPAGLMINTDRAKLGLIMTNLLTNAVSYSPDHAEILINAEIRNETIVLSVKKASINLKPEDILPMRDRFWRKQKEEAGFIAG
ncbi:MAG: signal transduction histidine kinase [Planctomycetota bacterium]|jgi:signal transduction histidine kinase